MVVLVDCVKGDMNLIAGDMKVETCCFLITQNISELKGVTPASFDQQEQALDFLSVIGLTSKTLSCQFAPSFFQLPMQ